MKECPASSSRITIGVLISDLTSPFYRGLVQGVNSIAPKYNINVVFFAGGVINPPDNGVHRNLIFNLIRKKQIDGLIIPASPLSRYSSKTELRSFFDKFDSIPIVNVGSPVDWAPSVVPDISGTELLLEHLYFKHGYKRVAMIRGPRNHLASESRFQVYLQFLEKHDIPFNPEFIATTDISIDGGENGIRMLEEQIGLDCEVIMVMGDQMLIRAVNSLKVRGYKIPDDIKIVGLQGVSDGQFFDPPLTVVDDLVFEQARTGLCVLFELIKGNECERVIKQPAELIIRSSCGCNQYSNDASLDSGDKKALKAFFLSDTINLIQIMKSAAAESSLDHRYPLEPNDLSIILNKIQDAVEQGDNCQLCKAVESILQPLIHTRYRLTPWIGALLSLYKKVEKRLLPGVDVELWNKIWKDTIILLNEVQINAMRLQEKGYIELTDIYRRLGAAILIDYNSQIFKSVLADTIGIEHCYIVLYDKDHKMNNTARVMFAYKNKTIIELPDGGYQFSTDIFLPDFMLPDKSQFTLLIEPLYYSDKDFGYLIMSMEISEVAFYPTLRTELSVMFNNQSQLQETILAQQRFSDIAYSSSEWLWETNAEGIFIYCSEGAHDVIGYTAQEILGKTLFDFLDLTESEYKNNVKKKLFDGREKIRNIESWNIHKDGHKVVLMISGTPVLSSEGLLSGCRGVFKDISEQKHAEEEMKHIAYYDRLTGVPNRVLFMDRLDQAHSLAKRHRQQFALLFIDLDKFKFVNDTYGHGAGDLLLRTVASRILSCIREVDTLSRIGGDEFIILLNNICSADGIDVICRRIVEKLSPPIDLNGYLHSQTCSIGISLYPKDGEDVPELIKNADYAMYCSKKNGGNQYSFFN